MVAILGAAMPASRGMAAAAAHQLADAATALVWCHDEARALVSRKPAHRCRGRIIGEDAAREIEADRTRLIKRRFKGKKLLFPGRRLAGSGSGFFINLTGHVVTNQHVIATCKAVSVTPVGGAATAATVIAGDPASDLALLQAPVTPPGIAVFRDKGHPLPGDDVAVVGYPLRVRMVIRPFIVTGHVYVGDGPRSATRFAIKIDIRRGNSGSPVMDRSGRVIGVVSADVNTPKVYKKTGKIIRDVGIAIRLPAVLRFLRRHQVAFAVGVYDRTLSEAALFAHARQFVAQIGCWK